MRDLSDATADPAADLAVRAAPPFGSPLVLTLERQPEGDLDPAEAIATVVAERRRHLLGIAIGVLGDVASAEDVVQDTVEAMLRVRPDLADADAIIRYATRTVVNRSRSVLRRRAIAGRYLHATREEVVPPADESLLVAEDHREVLALFKQLPQRQREVLTLRHFALLEDSDIADALGVALGTVRSNASRGLATLSRLLRETADD